MTKDQVIKKLEAIAAEIKLNDSHVRDAIKRCNEELARFALYQDGGGELMRAYQAIINSCRIAV